MTDLFSYPDNPGFKHRDTSRAAAEDMKPKQRTIQEEVLAALAIRPMASFELAAHIGRSYRSIQPRTSELSQPSDTRPAVICDSGDRPIDPETGKAVIRWRLI